MLPTTIRPFRGTPALPALAVAVLCVCALLAARSSGADVYASSEAKCIQAGYDKGILQVGGPWQGQYKCKCDAAPNQIVLDNQYASLFTESTMKQITGLLQTDPGNTDVTIGGTQYTLESQTGTSTPTMRLYAHTSTQAMTPAALLMAGDFAKAPVSGSQTTVELKINGSGQPDGGLYKHYAGVLTPTATAPSLGNASRAALAVALAAPAVVMVARRRRAEDSVST